MRLTDPTTEEVILNVPLNQLNQVTGPHGTWKIALFTKDQFDATYNITNLSVPAAVNAISANYSVAERGKLTGVLGLNYQGQDKEQITKVLNAILATYSAQNIERRSAESAQTLKFLDEQLPDLKKQLDDAERQFNKFRQQYNTVDVTKESELYLTQSITLETKKLSLNKSKLKWQQNILPSTQQCVKLMAKLLLLISKLANLTVL